MRRSHCCATASPPCSALLRGASGAPPAVPPRPTGRKRPLPPTAPRSRWAKRRSATTLRLCLLQGQAAAQQSQAIVEEALDHLQKATCVYRQHLPPSSPSALALRRSLARCHIAAKDASKAVAVLEPALKMLEEVSAPTVQELGQMHFLLGRACLMQKEVQKSRHHFEWVLGHPAVAESLSEAERKAAEDLVHRGCELETAADTDAPPSATKPDDLAAKGDECAEPEPDTEVTLSEPQGEPAPAYGLSTDEEGVNIGSLAAGAKRRLRSTGTMLHFSFGDVDVRTLSVLNRVPYLMEARIKEGLGVNPPMGDFHVAARGEEAVAIHDASSIEAPISLDVALERMGSECARLPA